MPVTELDDGTGETLRVLEVDGYYTPKFDCVMTNQEAEFRSIPEWKGREGDILICAYPKSGTHWLWEVASMLMNGSADRVKLIKETSMLEGIPQAAYDSIPSPRALNSHLLFHMLPKDILAQRSKIVFINRNPKDVCVSFYNHHYKIMEYNYQGKWENYVDRFMKGLVDYGSWFDYTRKWEKVIQDNPDHPIHVMSYEDMQTDNIKEITKLSKFLAVKEDRELIESIADRCDFSRMKKEKDQLEDEEEWRGGEPGMYRKDACSFRQDLVRENTLAPLSDMKGADCERVNKVKPISGKPFVEPRGHVGDWKNWFTVAQSERFDSFYAQRMAGSKFTFRYS